MRYDPPSPTNCVGGSRLSRRAITNPGPAELFDEWARALDMYEGSRPLPADEDRLFVSAVEHALDWARGSQVAVPPAA